MYPVNKPLVVPTGTESYSPITSGWSIGASAIVSKLPPSKRRTLEIPLSSST